MHKLKGGDISGWVMIPREAVAISCVGAIKFLAQIQKQMSVPTTCRQFGDFIAWRELGQPYANDTVQPSGTV